MVGEYRGPRRSRTGSKRRVCNAIRRNCTNYATPEGKLWAEVLCHAVHESGRADAQWFFMSHRFPEICAMAGIEPGLVEELMIEYAGWYRSLKSPRKEISAMLAKFDAEIRIEKVIARQEPPTW